FHDGGGGTWEGDPNKEVAVGTADTTVPVRFFNFEEMPSGDTTNVTFEVDMRLRAKQGNPALTPGVHKVYVAGSFTDWATSAVEMSDANNDSVYTVTTSITSGQLIKYKFIFADGPSTAGTQWESPVGDDVDGDGNRQYWVIDGDQTVARFWNNDDPNVTLADGNIYFEVDMSVATELGVFNPNTDSVQIRGAFNGWNDSDPEHSLMNQDAADENLWYLEIPLVQQQVNGGQRYKFFIKKPSGDPEYSNTGWEVPIGNTVTGDRNREILFEGSPTQEAERAYFENIHPAWVIPQGTSVEAKFSVDMRPAMPGFNPSADTVWWIPRQPLYYAINNLEWNLEQKVLRLTDVDNDSVYTGTLTIDGPAFNGFLYNYAYETAGGFVQEEGAQGD
ncbi:MAG: hypothetical protein MN733_33035, partial [Nitrososphaera sp.]|nr:hypothetical protein [Nitrososphaera sp.]